jgi:hypothetical protein
MAAVPATIWLLLGPSNAARRVVAALTISAWLQVGLPRLFWQHYYLLPLPGIAIGVAVFLADAFIRCRDLQRSSRPGKAGLWGLVALALVAGIAGTALIQVQRYLLVPPPELAIRYKGGGQWVVLRDLGRELGRRSRIWRSPHLFVWGWQSPLFLYSGLDGVTPHFFADPLLKAYATKNHPLIRPRIDRIMRDLHARPPELIFSGDPPFAALASFLLEHYRPVVELGPERRMPITPDGRGLWVERRSFDLFEAAMRATRERAGPAAEAAFRVASQPAEEAAKPAGCWLGPTMRR